MMESSNYINGEWVLASSGHFTANMNPANLQEMVGTMPRSTAVDVNHAVDAAAAAFPAWKALSGQQRGDYLLRAALLLEQRADQIAELITKEMGKTFPEARGEALRGAAILKYYAGEGVRAIGDHIPAGDGKSLLYTKRIPLGVAALITPWNFPIAIPLWKMAPALIYGNTVVLKPAADAGLTASLLAEILHEALFPPGVINIVHGSGSVVGNALIDHPKVEAVSFTGSNKVGRDIAVKAAQRGIKFQLEMGGKNAVIVLADADLEKAADHVVSGSMKSTGQKCTATSNVIVEQSVKEAFVEKLLARINAIEIGNGLEPSTYFGPLATQEQQRKVLSCIEQGIAEGAVLRSGGKVPEGAAYADGWFIEPTLFEGVTPGMTLAREEIFGPVLSIMEANSLEEAIDLANGTDYGLSAAIYTRSLGSAMTFIDKIEAGMVKVNAETAGVEYHAPFGGLKQSSSHSREQGRAAMEFFTHTQTISISI